VTVNPENPFQSPQTQLSKADGAPPRSGIALGSLLAVLGGLISIYGLGLLLIEARHRLYEDGPQSIYFILPLAGGILSSGCGGMWLVSALCCFQRRLRAAAALGVIGAGLFVGFFLLVYVTIEVYSL
jgi:hypothetical protein